MKIVEKKEFLDNGIRTKKYYFFGVRYLKKRWAPSFKDTYLFKFKISSHYKNEQKTVDDMGKRSTFSGLMKYVSPKDNNIFTSDNIKSATVVIPVYNGVEHLEKLIPSLIKNTPEFVKIIIIDDCSPDKKTVKFLEKLKKDQRFYIERNKQNLGFVKTTNRAMSLVETKYAVWLNSDTVVPEFWLERLLSQFNAHDKIASITPFSNSGTIFSFPDFGLDNGLAMPFEKLDRAFQRIQNDTTINSTYSGTGFCMAIDMDCWREVGELDYDAFDKGYGEENDWCFRAGQKGYKHLIAPNLFVWHRHGGSFLSEEKKQLCQAHQLILRERYPHEMNSEVPAFVSKDPWKDYRNIAAFLCCNENTVLIIDLKQKNTDKSGAIDYRHNMIKELQDEGHDVILLEYERQSDNEWNVVPVSLSKKISVNLDKMSDVKLLFNLLDIKQVIINNLAFFNGVEGAIDTLYEIKQQYGPKMTYKFHDHLSVCPSFFLLNDNGVDCKCFGGTSKCENCLRNNRFRTIPRSDIVAWRNKWNKLFSCVDEFNFFSEYTLNKVKQVYPIVDGRHIIKEHTPLLSSEYTKYSRPTPDEQINIAFVGSFYHEKGAHLFIELANICRTKNQNMNFYIIGVDNPSYDHKNIKYIGGYTRDELGKILTENNIHAVVYSSIGNETFSYLVQELMILKVPFVCFDNGAHAERIKKYKYNLAKVADNVSPESLSNALQDLIKKVYNI